MQLLFSKYWMLIAAIWYSVNGLLHDAFVIMRHKGGYDRELLLLLMDGHVLLLSGALLFAAYVMYAKEITYAATISIIVSAGMIVYCCMIFPFLKSFGTLLISFMLLFAGIKMLCA